MSGAPGSRIDLENLSKKERVGLAAQLYGGTPASGLSKGIAGLLGASDFTGALAGDAFMPAALGADGMGMPSFGAKLGGKLRDPKMADNLFAGMQGAQSAWKAQQAEQDRIRALMASARRPEGGGPIKNTLIYPMDQSDPEAYRRWLAMLHGGFGPG